MSNSPQMRLFSSVSLLNRTNGFALGVAAIAGIGWALITIPSVSRASGVISVIAGLTCGVCGLRIAALRRQDAVPRTITTDQMARFLGFTSIGTKGRMNIAASVADNEAVAYCDEISKMLRLAGWDVQTRLVAGKIPGVRPYGLMIRVADVIGDRLQFIRDAFREALIDVATVRDDTCIEPEIFVGPKESLIDE